MTFALRVLGDGLGSPSVPWNKMLSSVSTNNWQVGSARDLHARPVEFSISPAAGTVGSMSEVTIKVVYQQRGDCFNLFIVVVQQ